MEESDAKTKGEKTEALVLAELVKKEIEVLLPFGENHRFDFGVIIEGEFLKLQCKTGRIENGTIVFSTRSTRPRGNGYSKADYNGEIDGFIVGGWNLCNTYLIPIEEASRNEMVLREAAPKNNQSKGINWAEEYRIDAQIKSIQGT